MSKAKLQFRAVDNGQHIFDLIIDASRKFDEYLAVADVECFILNSFEGKFSLNNRELRVSSLVDVARIEVSEYA